MRFTKGYVINYTELVTEYNEKFRVYPDQTITYYDWSVQEWLLVNEEDGLYTGEQIELIYQETAKVREARRLAEESWA